MQEPDDDSVGVLVCEGSTRIPIRNLWLLYLYASELYQHLSASERVQAERIPPRSRTWQHGSSSPRSGVDYDVG